MATHLDLEEQEQLDALKHFWNKWGNLITWVLIAVLGAYAAWNGWQYWQRRQAAMAAVLYDEIDRAAKAGQAGNRAHQRVAHHLGQAAVALHQIAGHRGHGQQERPLHGGQPGRWAQPLCPKVCQFIHACPSVSRGRGPPDAGAGGSRLHSQRLVCPERMQPLGGLHAARHAARLVPPYQTLPRVGAKKLSGAWRQRARSAR